MTDQGAYSEVFEEGMDIQQAQTIHRIRANSTIMKLKKILGGSHLSLTLGMLSLAREKLG
jgi:pyruvate carboxylase